jgi:hypothetical protein
LIFIPQILARALPTALLGGIMVTFVIESRRLHLEIKDSLYYPTTISVSILCWIVIIGNWLLYLS